MPRPAPAREKLLTEAIRLIRLNGYAATSVDALCSAAGVTKGAFFHHFRTKDALAEDAAGRWDEVTSLLFAGADFHDLPDPLDRVLGYLRLRRAMLDGPLPEVTCYLGTTVQEVYATSPAVRDACREALAHHVETVERDIALAVAAHPPLRPVDPAGLSLHFQVVLQGAFVIAKAWNDTGAAQASLDHLIAYVELLFGRGASEAA